jgi:hypothetical protein
MVAGMGGVARRAFRRGGRAAADLAPRRRAIRRTAMPPGVMFSRIDARSAEFVHRPIAASFECAPTDFGSYLQRKIAPLEARSTQRMTILLRFHDFHV